MSDVFVIQGRPTDEVFTFEEGASKKCYHFNVSAIDRWLYAQAHAPHLIPHRWKAQGIKYGVIPLPRDQIEKVILPKKLWEERRVEQLKPPYLNAPIVTVLWPDNTTVLIDGNHRMIRHYRDGAQSIKMIQLPFKFAMNFSMDLPGRGTLDIDDPRVPNNPMGDFLRKNGVV